MTKQFSYSSDGEDFHGDFNTRLEAIQSAIASGLDRLFIRECEIKELELSGEFVTEVRRVTPSKNKQEPDDGLFQTEFPPEHFEVVQLKAVARDEVVGTEKRK